MSHNTCWQTLVEDRRMTMTEVTGPKLTSHRGFFLPPQISTMVILGSSFAVGFRNMNSHPCHPKHSVDDMQCLSISVSLHTHRNLEQHEKDSQTEQTTCCKDILPLNSFVSQACSSSWAMDNFHARFPPFLHLRTGQNPGSPVVTSRLSLAEGTDVPSHHSYCWLHLVLSSLHYFSWLKIGFCPDSILSCSILFGLFLVEIETWRYLSPSLVKTLHMFR